MLRRALYVLTTVHPLRETLDRLLATFGGDFKVELGTPQGDGWYAARELVERRHDVVQQCMAAILRAEGADDRRVGASFFFKSYCSAVIGAGVAMALIERRVADLSIDNMHLHLHEAGGIDGIALTRTRIAVLPDDPAADHPDAVVVATEAELGEYLLACAVDEHLAYAVEAWRPVLRLGKPALWGLAADTDAGFAMFILERLQQAERCDELIPALLDRPRLRGSGVIWLDIDGERHPVLKRAACCFAYRSPNYPHCDTCPLLSEAEREARMRESLRGQ